MLSEAHTMHAHELDFTREAQNLEQIGNNLRRARVAAVVPTAVAALTTPRVLVMHFCEGTPLTRDAELRNGDIDLQQLLERVCEAWAVQLFVDGHFQCDPHPGNLLVTTPAGAGAAPV